MTTGSWDRSSFSYPIGPGIWIGTKKTKNWTGSDRNQPPAYNKATDHTVMRVGLGAGQAKVIFDAQMEEAISSERAVWLLNRGLKKARYEELKRKAEEKARKRIIEGLERESRDRERRESRRRDRDREKADRKSRKVPLPKEYRNLPTRDKPPGMPHRDIIPVYSYTIKVPAKERPRPPRRVQELDHPYEMHALDLNDTLVTFPTSLWGNGSWNTNGVMNIFGAPDWLGNLSLTTNDLYKLIDRLKEQVRGSSFNAAVMLAESNKSFRLIGDSAIRVAKAIFHARTGDWWGASRSLFEGTTRAPLAPRRDASWGSATQDAGVLAQRILELQYGIKPLLNDVYQGAQFVAHQLNAPLVRSYRASVARTLTTKRATQWSIYVSPAAGYKLGKVTAIGSKRVSSRVIARVSESGLPTIADALGLTDPATVAWELTPLSFVWDWWQPIGPYLEARSFVQSLTALYVTTNMETGRSYPPQSEYWKLPGGFRGHSGINLYRSISTSLQVPKPTYIPVSANVNFQHALNGLALLAAGGASWQRNREIGASNIDSFWRQINSYKEP